MTLDDYINAAVKAEAARIAGEVESRILAGENDFEFEGIRYIVPAWREHPWARLRIELARRLV